MTAGMHVTRVFGPVGDIIGLFKGQRIHVGPEGHNRTGILCAQLGHDAGRANAALKGNAQGGQLLANLGRGLFFPIARLGELVKPATQINQPVKKVRWQSFRHPYLR